MVFDEFSSLLSKNFAQNGLNRLNDKQIEQFYTLTTHLLEVNTHTNLTAIRDVPAVISKHLSDSCLAAEHFPENARALDIGCGAGFPSLPLAIYRPDLKITAMDSTDKKVRFVAETAEMLSLKNLQTISGRAEDRELMKKLGRFDVVTSRAVSRLSILAEISIPYIEIGGKMVALKGADGENELKEAMRGIRLFGCEVVGVQNRPLTLHDSTTEERCILVLQKKAPTPPQYPRPYNTIKKSPIVS